MAKLMWCPNCNQNVSPQKNKSHMGCAILVLFMLGIALFFFNFILGIVVLAVAGSLLVLGLLFGIASVATRAHCPICKAKNLSSEQSAT
jgi:hypothetical protein